MDTEIISSSELAEKSHTLYKLVDYFSLYEAIRKDYGTGEFFSMTEIHMLEYIENHPGILATELARGYRRSKSLISRMVNLFEKLGYLTRIPDASDSKKKYLYLTQKGKQLSDVHTRYDENSRLVIYRYLRRRCTHEEVESFYKVAGIYAQFLEEKWLHLSARDAEAENKENKKEEQNNEAGTRQQDL